MENENTRVIGKVQKLLAMANCGGASEQERETAMRQAYSLLAKHNLTLESIDKDSNPREIQSKEGHSMAWSRMIAKSVAELFFCSYVQGLINKTNRCQHLFIGKRSNAIVACDLADYLINSVFREGSRRMKKEGGLKPYAWRMDFGKGAAIEIRRRCAQLRAQKEAELNGQSVPGTSIVLASLYQLESEANEEFVKSEMKTKLEKSTSKGAGNPDAFRSGREFGSSLPLACGIKDNGQGQLKLK